MTTKIPAELSSTPSISDSGNATAITIDSSEDVTVNNGTLTSSGANGVGNQGFHITDTGYSKTHKLFGDNSLHIQADSGQSILMKPNASEIARFTSDGLTFNGDTAAANALDDYEEGTWTPAVSGGTSAGSTTHTNQNGYYVKVGSLVTATCFIRYTAATGSGYLKLTGLPYAVANLTQHYPTAPVLIDNLNWGGGTYLAALAVPNLSEVNLYYLADDAGSSRQDITNELVAFRFTVTYRS